MCIIFSKARGLLFQCVEGCVHSAQLGFSGHRTFGKDDKQLIGSHCWGSAGIQQNCISLVLRTCVLDDVAFSFGSSLPTVSECAIEPHYVSAYEAAQLPPSVNRDYASFHSSTAESRAIFLPLKLTQGLRNNSPASFKRDCRQDNTNGTHPQDWNLKEKAPTKL